MNKFSGVLATLVALLGTTTSWAQDAEKSEPAAATAAAPASCDTGCCDTGCCQPRETCRSRFRSRLASRFDRSDCCSSCNNCGQKCSWSALRAWLCFHRETVRCPKGPTRRLPPLYTFFPCDDCGDGCGSACANNDCCNTCDK